MAHSTTKPTKRFTFRKLITGTALALAAVCLLSSIAFYLTLPYGMGVELAQMGRDLLAERFFPTEPQPVVFSPELAQAAARIAEPADLDRMMADLTWLADDARQGRKAGTPSEDEVGAWLIERVQVLGLRPLAEAGLDGYAQTFPSSVHGQPGENIIAVLEGSEQPARYLLVGAHYDHTGVSEDGQVYNGADDNASGVAAVLEAARLLSAGQPPRETIIFVFFSNEEDGRRGATALARLLRAKGLARDTQFLNLECLGAVRGTDLYLDVWDEDSPNTHTLVEAVLAAGDTLEIPIMRKGRDPSSDATRMLAYGIPSVTIDAAYERNRTHPYMHTPEDDVAVLDPQGLLMGARAAAASAWLLANDGY